MDQTPATHAVGCRIYPPEVQVIEIGDAVKLLSLAQQLLTLCIRMSAKIDPAADFLVGRAAERVAGVSGRGRRPRAIVVRRPQAKSEAKSCKLGLAPQLD